MLERGVLQTAISLLKKTAIGVCVIYAFLLGSVASAQYYDAPYHMNAQGVQNRVLPTIEEVIDFWWVQYQQLYWWAFPGCYYTTNYLPDPYETGVFASVTLHGTCGGGNGIFGAYYPEEPSIYALEAPMQTSCDRNETNPCNPADGTKTQAEVDYSSPTEGGLAFQRYYRSEGAYRTAARMRGGWRHSYASRLDEAPDIEPRLSYPAPANQSERYETPEDACEIGWLDIRDTVWSGDLQSATASYTDGNVCTLSISGDSVAHFPVRSYRAWTSFTPPATVKTVVLPDGSAVRFEQQGSAWASLSNPGASLVLSGSDWIYTDTEDRQWHYDASGRLNRVVYRSGRQETLDYELSAAEGGDDDASTLDRVSGAFGHELRFSYNAEGLLDTVTTPDGPISYQYDSSLSQVILPDATNRQYLYEDLNFPTHLTGIVDENNDRFATWAYDDAGRAILSEHAGGKERVELAYNANGTTTLTMANGAERTYTFSTQQNERRVSSLSGDICSTCPGGEIASRTYDSNGFLDEVTDWNGNVTKTVRNSRGLTETLTEAYGSAEERETTIAWHSTFRLPNSINAPNHDIDYVYDSNGNPASITITDSVDSRIWSFTYNTHGQILTTNGPRTDVTDVTTFDYYDCTTGVQCGQLKSATNALSQVTTYDSYDASGRLTLMTDPNGMGTAFAYDDRGRLLTATQTPTAGSARVTTFAYDDAGQLVLAEMSDGLELTYTYTAAHYLESVTDNLGNSIVYDYDAMGNLKDEDTYDPASTLTRALDFVHDLNNRLDTITDGGFVTDLDYDDVGNLTDVADPASATTQHSYDALNRLEQTLDALSGYTDYTYDAHDNVMSVTAPNGATTTYEYDDLDNLVKEISPDRGTTTYTHDAAGNVTTATDARGKVTTYRYDALNRLAEIELDNSDTITFQYDTGTNAIGRLNKVTDPSGETTWTYNNFGEVTGKTHKIGTVSLTIGYSYDVSGRLTSMTLPSGKVVTYGYGTDHRPDSVTVDATTVLTGATYDPFGPVNSWTWGNTTPHSRDYDLRGLLETQSMATDTRTLSYDAAGRLVTLDDTRHDLGFDYDALGRLTDATAAGTAPLPASQVFTYDANGNRTSLTENGTPYTYTPVSGSNRLSSTTGPVAKTYSHDAAGNVLSDGLHSYGYDDRGRLVSVDSGAVSYAHNGQGQRVKKDTGTVTLFAYDEAGRLIGEYDAQGNALKETVWFASAPVAVLEGSAVYYAHTDHLGTPRAITDGTTVIWRWESDPFGTTTAQEDPDGDMQPFVYNWRFPGQYRDEETGLYYNYYRTYDPATGRYLESDPIGLAGGLNTYWYVSGNPLSGIDPLGLDALVISNGQTYTHGGGNPFGHTAIATTGSGVYSYGNNTDPGSSVADYLSRELGRRDTTLTIIKTTPEQEKAMIDYLKSLVDNPLTNEFPDYLSDNCAVRTSDALRLAGLPPMRITGGKDPIFAPAPNSPALPVAVQQQAEYWMGLLGGQSINVPMNSDLSSVLPLTNQFEPDCGCEQ